MDGVLVVISQLVTGMIPTGTLMVVKSVPGLIVVGTVLIIAGILTIVFRRAIRDAVVRAQTRGFGQSVGQLMESTRPWAFAVVGVGAICMGVLCLVLLLFF